MALIVIRQALNKNLKPTKILFLTSSLMISTSMIQRAILRQNGTASSFMKAAPRASLLKHRTRPNRLFVQSFPVVTPVRWYAAEPEIRRATDERPDVIEESQSEKAQTEVPLQKELEARNKEIIDLKVFRISHHIYLPLLTATTRISTCAQLRTFEIFRIVQNEKFKLRKILPFRSSPRI